MTRPQHFLLVIPIIGYALTSFSASASDLSEGQENYKNRKFDDATAYFRRAVNSNMHDAIAHYYLANCLMEKKSYASAATEYRLALNFTKDSSMSRYCRDALQKLSAHSETDTLKTVGSPAKNSIMPGAEDRVFRIKETLNRTKNQAKEILDRAEERCLQIQPAETDQEPSYNRGNRFLGRASDGGEWSYRHKQVRSTRQLAIAQADGLLAQGWRDAQSLGQGLPNLDDLLGPSYKQNCFNLLNYGNEGYQKDAQ